MIHGVDYNETFAPVAKMVTLRIFLSLVAVCSLHISALHIKTAFLNARLTSTGWMEPPANLFSSSWTVAIGYIADVNTA